MELYIIPASDQASAEQYIIYRPLLGLAFVGNRPMADLARRIADTTPATPADDPASQFLASIGFFEADPGAPKPPDGDFLPTTAVLLLTNQCQLRCTYCYAAAGEAESQQLTFDIARASIDHVHQVAISRGRDHFDLSFHGGGEPTLASKVMQAACVYARQKSIPAKITLTSNGVWSPALRQWILKNIDGLTLSIDGRPSTQDRQRPFASGRGSSARVMETIAELDHHGYPYGIRMTSMKPWEELPADVEYLCSHTRCRSIQVEPTFNTSRGGHGEAGEAEMLAFGRAFLQAWEIADRMGKRFYYSGARAAIRTATFCSAPFQALVTDIHGNLVSCYEVTCPAHPFYEISRIGTVDPEHHTVHPDDAARRHLLDTIEARRQSCRDCYCYWTCAGDCYVRAFAQGENGHLVHTPRCTLNRFLTRELLLYLIARGNGVWRGFIQYASRLPRQTR